MGFTKYQHIERFGTIETDGIDIGECYVFPKIDGTNGSIWLENDELQFGSRNNHLVDRDNAGFKAAMKNNLPVSRVLSKHPTWTLYGEWLVPHTFKDYQPDAWRKFYVFDVFDGEKLIHFEEYKPVLDYYGVEYIPPLRIIKNPTEERLIKFLEVNDYLVQDGQGAGEGIVIKNYAYRNRFDRQTWAKIVRSEFKTKHRKEMGAPKVIERSLVEEKIVEEFLTTEMIDKVYANIVTEQGGWSSKYIPRLLNTVFYDLVREECWNFVKKHKNPKIDFGRLMKLAYSKTKEIKPELF